MKHFRMTVAVGVAAFLLGSGASFLFAQQVPGWGNPTDTPPKGNVAAPLNVGDDVNNVRQEKKGGLIIKKDFDVGGKAKIGKTLDVGAGGTFGGSLVAPLVVAGPLSPAGASDERVLIVGGKIQIRGGGPAAGYVLTADSNGTASWQSAVREITAGSNNVTVTPSVGGGVTVSVSQPSIREVPPPPGGGQILVSNSEGSMSWEDKPAPVIEREVVRESATKALEGVSAYSTEQATVDRLCVEEGYSYGMATTESFAGGGKGRLVKYWDGEHQKWFERNSMSGEVLVRITCQR